MPTAPSTAQLSIPAGPRCADTAKIYALDVSTGAIAAGKYVKFAWGDSSAIWERADISFDAPTLPSTARITYTGSRLSVCFLGSILLLRTCLVGSCRMVAAGFDTVSLRLRAKTGR